MSHFLLLVQWFGEFGHQFGLEWYWFSLFSNDDGYSTKKGRGENVIINERFEMILCVQCSFGETNWQCLKGIEIPLHNLKSSFLRLLPSEDSRKGNPSPDHHLHSI